MIKDYYPSYYDEVLDFQELANTEDKLFQQAVDMMEKFHHNQFIPLMDDNFISEMEKMLEITSLTGETLEFRRARVINRLSSKPPFNMAYLKSKLDNIYGEGNYSLSIDYPNYQIHLESSSLNNDWFKEGYHTIMSAKPANMEYVHHPLVVDRVTLVETLSQAVGTRFQVGINRVGDPLLSLISFEEVDII